MRFLCILFISSAVLLSSAITATADASKGQGIYMNFCSSCHASGIAGAPKVGDKSDWQERTAKGIDKVTNNAIQGYQGKSGFMPAKGGMSALTDEEVSSAVLYMLEQSK